MNEVTRGYVYRIMLAVAALAVIYGLADSNQIAGWIGLGTAILGNGLASVNTSIKP